jgi:hypothetical protein
VNEPASKTSVTLLVSLTEVISVVEDVPASNVFICNGQKAWDLFQNNTLSKKDMLLAF